jgi:protein SCO1/2
MLALLAASLFLPVATCVGAAAALPSDSVYQLSVALTDQDGATRDFARLSGSVRVVSMFYANCPYICPLIVETIKRSEAALSADERARLQVLLVSLDPERDTPAELKNVAALRKVDEARWRQARTDPGQVRKLAAVLGIQYRQLENREVNHSSALILLDAQGRVLARSSRIGETDPEFIAALRQALGAPVQ